MKWCDHMAAAMPSGLLTWAILGEPAWLELEWFGWLWAIAAALSVVLMVLRMVVPPND